MAVRYVPQFIETDLGFYKDILDRREAEYEQAFAMPLEIEDMYANVPSTIMDIETKNEVLNDFKSRVEDIVYKKYSGDYAAARRDLAREVMKERQNPFFKIAPERYRLAEEERKIREKLGINYIPGRSVLDVPIRDENGNWITQDQLQHKYWDRGQLVNRLQTEFSRMASMVRDGRWSVSKDVKGLIEKARTRGITKSEVEPLAEIMAQTLINSDPELDPAIAHEIALNEANTYVLGYTKEERQDPGYKPGGSGNDDGPYNNFQTYEGVFKSSEKKERATKSMKAAQDIIQIEKVGTPLRGIAQKTGIISEYKPVEYVEPLELSQSILNYRDEVANGTAGLDDLVKHVGDNISKAFGQLKASYANHIAKTESVSFERAKQSLSLIFGEVNSLSPDDPVAAYENDPVIINEFLEQIPDDKKAGFGIERGEDGLLGFVDKDGRKWDLWNIGKNAYMRNKVQNTIDYLAKEITKGGADIGEYYDKKAKEVNSYLKENPYAAILAGDILANDPELSGIEAISLAMTQVEDAKINYNQRFNVEYDVLTQEDVTKGFVNKVAGSLGELEINELVEQDKGWFSKSKIKYEDQSGRGYKAYLAKIKKGDFNALRFDPVSGSIRATFLDDDNSRSSVEIPLTGANASKILPQAYSNTIQRVSNFLDPESFFKGEDLDSEGKRTLNFMGKTYVMQAVPSGNSLRIEISGVDMNGNQITEEDLYDEYAGFVNKALRVQSTSYSDTK